MGPRVGLDAVVRRETPFPCRESNPGLPARSLVTGSLILNMLKNI